MENNSNLGSHFESSFAANEGPENNSLERENFQFDPVKSDNPLNEISSPKNDTPVNVKFEGNGENHQPQTNSYNAEKTSSSGCEDSGYDRSEATTESSSTNGKDLLLSSKINQTPTEPCVAEHPSNHRLQADDASADFSDNVVLQSHPNNSVVTRATEVDSPSAQESSEDNGDINVEAAVPGTSKYSKIYSKGNKDTEEDSISIHSESLLDSSSPSIPATPNGCTSETSSSAVHQQTSTSEGVDGSMRRNSSSSRTSSTGSIDSDKTALSSPSSPPARKLKREGSSSPILMRKKKKICILSDTETENSFHSSENQNESCPTTKDRGSDQETADVTDFINMPKREKSEKRRYRKQKSEFITANDDLIAELINRMENAADEDRELNRKGLPATKKVAMTNYVVSQLRKKDLQPIFLEHNILNTLREWLSPMPSGCLPCLQIRDSILRVLADFPRMDVAVIRYSGIGRVLKFLRNHPAETKENKERCLSLIKEWSHPSQDRSYEYKVMTKKERELLDQELHSKYAQKKKQTASSKAVNEKKTRSLEASLMGSTIAKKTLKPGDSGWCPRARVPQPSVKDYVNRPVSKLSCEIQTKKKPNRFEIMTKKYQKTMRDKGNYRSAAKLSIVGNKM